MTAAILGIYHRSFVFKDFVGKWKPVFKHFVLLLQGARVFGRTFCPGTMNRVSGGPRRSRHFGARGLRRWKLALALELLERASVLVSFSSRSGRRERAVSGCKTKSGVLRGSLDSWDEVIRLESGVVSEQKWPMGDTFSPSFDSLFKFARVGSLEEALRIAVILCEVLDRTLALK